MLGHELWRSTWAHVCPFSAENALMEKNEKTKQINNLETPKSGHRHKKTGKENCYLEISKSEKPQDLEIFQYFFFISWDIFKI